MCGGAPPPGARRRGWQGGECEHWGMEGEAGTGMGGLAPPRWPTHGSRKGGHKGMHLEEERAIWRSFNFVK